MACLKTRVEQTHDRSGQPDGSNVHKVNEEQAPEEHREIASFNTNNKFNREIKEEDIDFNILGLPHSTVEQLHGASVPLTDKPFNVILNKVDNLIPSVKSQKI